MSDLFSFLKGADGGISWMAALGLLLFIVLALMIAKRVPFLRSAVS